LPCLSHFSSGLNNPEGKGLNKTNYYKTLKRPTDLELPRDAHQIRARQKVTTDGKQEEERQVHGQRQGGVTGVSQYILGAAIGGLPSSIPIRVALLFSLYSSRPFSLPLFPSKFYLLDLEPQFQF